MSISDSRTWNGWSACGSRKSRSPRSSNAAQLTLRFDVEVSVGVETNDLGAERASMSRISRSLTSGERRPGELTISTKGDGVLSRAWSARA